VEEGLKQGITVLDAGCGPGTWSLDMSETYRQSKFYGIYASAVFPENIKPRNVEFSIVNLRKEVPFQDNFFDFIFQRLLVFGLKDQDWENVRHHI
jgi:SAM-dependent methyltransferase